jgi:TonB-dependent starch-binding outer membrane protein SusC
MTWPQLGRRLALVGLLWLPATASAQTSTGTVRGRVTDANSGRGIADASVQVIGTRVGAFTNANGEYTLTLVPSGPRVLSAKRLGFQPTTKAVVVPVDGSVSADITLRESAVNLSEVLVTGSAAPTEKRKIGTSIASVDSTTISRAIAVTVDQALQGKVPGAQISQNSGGPGGGGISVRLRGTNSFISGSDPLYIVDGVIIDNGSSQLTDLGGRSNPQNRLADINPSDIERVEIIRGAAAAALYGSRANNGVVQIFTKRGSIGKPRFTLSSRFASNELREQQPFNFYPFDVNGLAIARYNYQDDIFRRSNTIEQNLTVEGGNDQTRYFMSANVANDEGILKSTRSNRQGARINLQQQLASNLIANVTGNYVRTTNDLQAFGEQNDYGIMGSLFFAPTQTDWSTEFIRCRRRSARIRCWPLIASGIRRRSTGSSGPPSSPGHRDRRCCSTTRSASMPTISSSGNSFLVVPCWGPRPCRPGAPSRSCRTTA